MAQIKTLSDVHIGDTVTDAAEPAADGAARLQGAEADGVLRAVPGRTTTISRTLREALGKLQLNDSSFTYQPEISEGLGFGFRCGFLGMLHREIIQQRLERDSELDLVQTAPNVTYEILTRKGEIDRHRQPAEGAGRRPDRGVPRAVRAASTSCCRPSNIGDLMQLCTERRGVYVRTEYLSPTRAILVYEMPLAEIIYDLYDKLKSGDARLRHDGLRLPRLPPRRPGAARRAGASATASTPCRPSSTAATADRRGRKLLKKLREEIDRHLFEVALAGGHRQPDHRPRDASRR